METWCSARGAVAELAAGFDPSLLTVSDCLALLPVITEIKNVTAAVESALAGRVAESDRWRASGARSAAEDYARRTATSVGAARDTLAAAEAMRSSERLRAAALSGRLSPAQAAVIGETAQSAPDAVDVLLDLVESGRGGSGGGGGSLPELRAAAQRAKAAADPDPDAARRRIHAARSVWTRRDPDGSAVLSWRDNPERIDLAHAALADLHQQLFSQARRDRRRERPDALDADALYLRLTGQPAQPTPPPGPHQPPRGARRGGVFRDAKILIRDVARRGAAVALVATDDAGHVETVAHLPRARSATLDLTDRDSLTEQLARHGTPVAGIVHTGRAPTAAQVSALQWTSPTCAAHGCASPRTQIDHTTGWAITRTTTLDDLDPLCAFHHNLKTTRGWRLDPGTGPRPFRPPEGRRPRAPDDRRG